MAEEVNTIQVEEKESTEKPTKPEYVQDKFWNKETGQVNIEEQSLSYNALEKKLGARTDELSKQIREDIEKEQLNKVPKEYELKSPEIPEGINLQIDKEMPILQWWEKTARDKGLSQDEYNDGIKAFVDNQISALPSREIEEKELGENAKQRIEAAEMWAKKNFSQSNFDSLANFASTANGVKVIEEMMKLTKDAPIPETETAIEAAPSLADLRSMMNDPRYHDAAKRDQAYIDKVTKLYEKYYTKAEPSKG